MKVRDIFLTFFFIGRTPVAPGTAASILTLALVYIVSYIFGEYALISKMIMLLVLLVIGFYYSAQYSKDNIDGPDPSYIVIDESIGMLISVLFIDSFVMYIIAFSLFRFFDILKPSIIFHSQYFKNGIGIIMDDLVAGIIVMLMLLGV